MNKYRLIDITYNLGAITQPTVKLVTPSDIFTIDNDIRNTIMIGDARAVGVKLPSKSISNITTSPPYYRKRLYSKKVQIGDEIHCYPEPTIWYGVNGKADCEHDWKDKTRKVHNGRGDAQKSGKYSTQKPIKDTIYHYHVCSKCTAYKGELGQEETHYDYIADLASVFDPLLNALRDDGTCFINLGDSMIKKEQANIPILFSEEMKKRGWLLRRDIIWYKKNAMSSSDPSNFTIDYEHFFFFVKRTSKSYYYETQFKPYADSTIKEILKDNPDPDSGKYADSGVNGGMRMKANIIKKTRIKWGGERASEYGNPMYSGNEWEPLEFGAFMRSVWDITTKGTSIKHYAAWPAELCAIPIKFGCPTHICSVCNTPRRKVFRDEKIPTRPGKNVLMTEKSGSNSDPNAGFHQSDWSTKRMKIKRTVDGFEECSCPEPKIWKRGIVLDPFGGTGMTGIVASELGCDYICFEQQEEFAGYAVENFKMHENKSVFRKVKKSSTTDRRQPSSEKVMKSAEQSVQPQTDSLPLLDDYMMHSKADQPKSLPLVK